MKFLIISKFTLLEVIRSKILVGIILSSIALLTISYVISEFAFGAASKVALDVGFGLLSFINLGIAIFLGSTLISKEVETKTLYMILSRPITRSSFLFGRIVGLSSIIIINTLILGLISLAVFSFYGGTINSLMYISCLFSIFESILILLITVLFSLVTNVTLSVIFSISLTIVGHSISTTIGSYFAKANIFFYQILKIAILFIPDLERFNLKDYLIYEQTIDPNILWSTFIYFALFTVSIGLLVGNIFNKKNLD